MVSSIAMRATILAYPMYSGTNLLVGQVLNYMQVDMRTGSLASGAHFAYATMIISQNIPGYTSHLRAEICVYTGLW